MEDNKWFEVEKIDDDTWAISEPYHPQDSHFYLLRGYDAAGEEESLLIDAGLGVLPIRPIVEECVSSAPRVVLTHAHWDHIGGLHEYPRFAVHEAEADLLRPALPQDPESMQAYVTDEDALLPDSFSLDDYCAYTGAPERMLKDGDTLRCGDRLLEVIHVPGHSPASVCFFEREKSLLFCGDIVYKADIWAQFESCDLAAYKRSLKRLLDIPDKTRVFPGHCEMDLPSSFISDVYQAFCDLDEQGELCHGSGEHLFQGFSLVF